MSLFSSFSPQDTSRPATKTSRIHHLKQQQFLCILIGICCLVLLSSACFSNISATILERPSQYIIPGNVSSPDFYLQSETGETHLSSLVEDATFLMFNIKGQIGNYIGGDTKLCFPMLDLQFENCAVLIQPEIVFFDGSMYHVPSGVGNHSEANSHCNSLSVGGYLPWSLQPPTSETEMRFLRGLMNYMSIDGFLLGAPDKLDGGTWAAAITGTSWWDGPVDETSDEAMIQARDGMWYSQPIGTRLRYYCKYN